MKIMYTIPSDLTIKKVVITPQCVSGGDPTVYSDPEKPRTLAVNRK